MGKGYNKSLFGGVPRKNSNKSRFNMSHEWKAHLMPGKLVPCMRIIETLPGDEWEIDSEFMFRFSPMWFPIMHKLTMRADYFYCPNRILWLYMGLENAGWTRWIAMEYSGLFPTVDSYQGYETGQFTQQVLAYLGVPLIDDSELDPGATDNIITELNAMPLSAYLKIYDEYYRIPQLEAEIWFPLQDGDNTAAFGVAFAVEITSPKYFPVLSSKWEKDYFTSALPSPLFGGNAIQLPLVSDVDGDGNFWDDYPTEWRQLADGAEAINGNLQLDAGDSEDGAGNKIGLNIQQNAGTIKDLRYRETLQSFYERIIKIGQRYRGFIEGLWGVDPEPGTIDIPIQFGSKFGRVQIADVMTQADTNGFNIDSRTGDYRGQANLYESGGGSLKYRCHEHGMIICLLQVNPNTSYGQGIERFWRRSIATDFALDMFSSIGDQEILKEELLYNPIDALGALNQETWGYIPRFSEMRYINNLHVGHLNYQYGKSQHLGRIWSWENWLAPAYALIDIHDEFTNVSWNDLTPTIEGAGKIRNGDVFRVLPDQLGTSLPTEPVIYAHIFHSMYVNRELPLYSVPDLT